MDNDNSFRVLRTQISALAPCPPGIWLVARTIDKVGTIPIVAWGRVDTSAEYASTSKWMACVCQDYTLVTADSVPGAIGLLLSDGPPQEARLLEMIEENDG